MIFLRACIVFAFPLVVISLLHSLPTSSITSCVEHVTDTNGWERLAMMGLNILKTWLDLILAWQNILGLMWAKYFSKHYSFVIMYARTGMRFQLAQWTSKSFTMLLCSLMVHDYYHDYYPLEVNLIILVSDWLVMKPSICPCAIVHAAKSMQQSYNMPDSFFTQIISFIF